MDAGRTGLECETDERPADGMKGLPGASLRHCVKYLWTGAPYGTSNLMLQVNDTDFSSVLECLDVLIGDLKSDRLLATWSIPTRPARQTRQSLTIALLIFASNTL